MSKILNANAIPGIYTDALGNTWQIQKVASETYSIQKGSEIISEHCEWCLNKVEDEMTGNGVVLYCPTVNAFNVFPNGLSLKYNGAWVNLNKN